MGIIYNWHSSQLLSITILEPSSADLSAEPEVDMSHTRTGYVQKCWCANFCIEDCQPWRSLGKRRLCKSFEELINARSREAIGVAVDKIGEHITSGNTNLWDLTKLSFGAIMKSEGSAVTLAEVLKQKLDQLPRVSYFYVESNLVRKNIAILGQKLDSIVQNEKHQLLKALRDAGGSSGDAKELNTIIDRNCFHSINPAVPTVPCARCGAAVVKDVTDAVHRETIRADICPGAGPAQRKFTHPQTHRNVNTEDAINYAIHDDEGLVAKVHNGTLQYYV